MLISFVLPVYNVKPWLQACLDSLPPDDDIQIICVDDGSQDGSAEILDLYAARDCRYQVVHQDNRGVGAARNAGLKCATGDYVVFVDPDDVLRKGTYQTIMEQIKSHPDADIYAFANVQFQDGEKPIWNDATCTRVVDVSEQLSHSLLTMCVCGMAFKKSVLPIGGFGPYRRGEDLLFVGQCLAKANVVADSECAIYGYRQRSQSAMHSPMTIDKLKDRVLYSREWIKVLSECGKSVDKTIYRNIGLNMTEGFVFDIYELDKATRPEMWRVWYNALKWLNDGGVLTGWVAFVVCVCNVCHLRSVALVLCWLPRKLKLMGIHR